MFTRVSCWRGSRYGLRCLGLADLHHRRAAILLPKGIKIQDNTLFRDATLDRPYYQEKLERKILSLKNKSLEAATSKICANPALKQKILQLMNLH